jgi:hypothetical protein
MFLALGGLAAALAVCDGEAATAKSATKSANAQLHHAMMSELHQARNLLDLGLHDYHGHRAKADHEVGRAIHLLAHHHKGEKYVHKGEHVKPPLHTGEIDAQMQQQSDQKLRQAQKLIQAAEYQLTQLHTKHGHKHHQEAAQMLTAASREIDQALTVLHNYNQHHKKAQQVVNP